MSSDLFVSLTSASFKPQTLQGADILAEELKAQVILPDFFQGDEPWPLDKYPPKTDEDKKKLQEWFGGFANPKNHAPKLIEVGKAAKKDGAEHVIAYGYCWGMCGHDSTRFASFIVTFSRWQGCHDGWQPIRHALLCRVARASRVGCSPVTHELACI